MNRAQPPREKTTIAHFPGDILSSNNSAGHTIQPLPTEAVHHIAAGEVIDSLAAAVRELIENALDAQASHIVLSLWPESGRIQVADNGIGMTLDDLLQAEIGRAHV